MPRPKNHHPIYRLRQRGRVWVITWTDEATGHTRTVSTGAAERGTAEKWRDQWLAGRSQPIPPSQATIAEIMQAYMTARLPHVESKATLRTSCGHISRLIGNLEPRMLGRGLYSNVRCAEVSSGTVRREIAALRAALHFAEREQWIDRAPYIEMPPAPPPRSRWLTREEVSALVLGASSPHVRLFIVLAYHTAARAGAILDLTWDRVDLERRRVHYARIGRRETKKRRATVPLNTAALAELQSAAQVRVTDYVIEFCGKPVKRIDKGFAAACRRAGLSLVPPHVLRHTAASHMVMAGVPVAEVARMLGDTVAMVEKVYGHHSPDYLRRAADALVSESVFQKLSTHNAKPRAKPLSRKG